MRRNRALGTAVIGVVVALAAAACSGSTGGDGGNGGNGGSNSGPLPLNINKGSGTPKKGGTLDLLGVGDVDYMDPNISYYSGGYMGLRLWSRQLLTYPAIPGKETTAAPDLATELPTEQNGGITDGGKTFKLTIRTGAKWNTSPARQVTAADVVRGVKRTCNPAQPFGGMPDFQDLIVGLSSYCQGYAKVDAKSASAISGYANRTNLAGVSVDPSNPLTVVFKLTSAASYFKSMLTLPAFSPSPVEYDKYIPASAQLAQNTISDGPYYITSYSPSKSIKMSRNSAWDASTDPIRKAYVDKININEVGNQDAIQQQLQAGTADADMEWDTFPPVAAVPNLIRQKDPNFNLRPTFSSNPYLVFNTVSPNNGKALQKTAVRQALMQGISRDNLIQDTGGPRVNPPLTHILPAGISGTKSNTSPDPFKFDSDKAKSALSDAGAGSLKIKVLYRTESSASKAIFQTLQQDLKAAGVTVSGVGASNDDFYTKYLQVPSAAKNGTFDIAIAGWGPDWYGDAAASFFQPLFYGNDGKAGSAFPPNGSNFGFYNNPKVDALIKKAVATPDATEAAKVWAQADQIVTNDAAIFPLTANNQVTYHASQTHNTVFIPALQQIDPANVWLSKG